MSKLPEVDLTPLEGVAIELTEKLQELTDLVEIVGQEAPPELTQEGIVRYHYWYVLQLKSDHESKLLLQDIMLAQASLINPPGSPPTEVIQFKNNILAQMNNSDSILLALVAFLIRHTEIS